jgi:arylsulfatase
MLWTMTNPGLTRRAWWQVAGGAALAAPSGRAAAAAGQPNFLVILADDLGFSDIGPYGGEIETPNLNRLAGEGVRFSQFYNCARCCPTRASLLTGLYNHQAGVGHMIQDRGAPSYQGYLNDRSVTLAEALKPAGYRTQMSGKWHVGEDKPHWPLDRGFDRYFGLISGASNYFRLDPGRKMALDAEPWTPPKDGSFYMTEAITDHAVRMINEAAGSSRPFFQYVAYTSPHWPLHALPEDIAKYRGKYKKGWDRLREERHARQIASGLLDRKWAMSPRPADIPAWAGVDNQDEWDLRMAVYAAQVDRMDQGIGRILAALRTSRQLDNTLLLFLADNGGCAEENIGGEAQAVNPAPGGADSFTSYRRPWANASNTPLRWWKQIVHEGGISTPLIAWNPRLVKGGNRIVHTPGHLIDIMPTLLDLAGGEYPKARKGKPIQPMEGRSLRPALEGRNLAPHAELAWEHQGHRAVRHGDWKLVARNRQPWELYHLGDDRTELKDRMHTEPARAKELEGAWKKWADRCGVVEFDRLPTKKKK